MFMPLALFASLQFQITSFVWLLYDNTNNILLFKSRKFTMEISNYDYVKNGYLLIPNFFESTYAEEIKEKILLFCNKKDNKYAVFKYPEKISRLFSYKFYKKNGFEIKDLDIMLATIKSTRIDNLKNLKDTLGLKKLYLIDSYLSKVTNNHITKWHCDQAYGGATDPGLYFNGMSELIPTSNINRVFVYLTNAEVNNGCFSYLPGSHKVGIAIRNMINMKLIEYKPFYELKDGLQLALEHKLKLIENNLLSLDEINYFIENAEFALSGKHDFCLESPAGSMIVFNDLGYHQGTAPTKSERLVMRYWF